MHADSGVFPDSAAVQGGAGGAPLIAHIIYRLDTGGLENGVVNLINAMPAERFRHAIICLTGYTEFRRRIRRSDVSVYALDKPPGNSPVTHFRLWRLLTHLRPEIVHTRNLAALEGSLPAALARVPVRIHGEHGRDVGDLDGNNPRFQKLRRVLKRFAHQYIVPSRGLGSYLQHKVGVAAIRIASIYNGVNTELSSPGRSGREPLAWSAEKQDDLFGIATVSRMQAVKDLYGARRVIAKREGSAL